MTDPFRLSKNLLFALLSFLVFTTSATAGSDLRPLKSGIWQGGVKGDDNGAPLNCYLVARAKSADVYVLLIWNGLGLHIGLFNERWKLKAGDKFISRVRIDNLFDQGIEALVATPTMIDYVFGLDEPSVESVQAGNRITMQTPFGDKSFPLRGTRKAINLLMDCADSYLTKTAPAPDFVRGLKAYKNKDYAGALREWMPLAEAGDARAQNRVGVLYYRGYGVTKNRRIAAQWIRKAAEQGNKNAQNNLGLLYRNGKGVPQSDAEAIKWFRKAAAQGHKKARKHLDEMLKKQRQTASASNTTSGNRWNSMQFMGDFRSKQGRTILHPGDKIDIQFTAEPGLDPASWIGFVADDAAPSPTPSHFAQVTMSARTAGAVTVEVPRMLGDYRLWMYDRYNGALLAEKPVRITIDTDSAHLALPSGSVLDPGQAFVVNYRASPNYSYYNWVAIVGPRTPRNISQEQVKILIGKQYLKNSVTGTLNFTAPTKPGKYLIRMQDQEFKKTLFQRAIIVREAAEKQPGPAAAPAKVSAGSPTIAATQRVFAPGARIEVTFDGLSGRGQDWLAIAGVDQGPKQYFDMVMLDGSPTSGRHSFRALPEGDYVVRLYLDWPNGAYRIAAQDRVSVRKTKPAAPQPVAPPKPAAPLPAAPVAPQTPPASVQTTDPVVAEPRGLSGVWEIEQGAFASVRFDQARDLVDGAFETPNGVFQGEISGDLLTGIWAGKSGPVGQACDHNRLGSAYWGKIEARLKENGTLLEGNWGSCGSTGLQVFRARRVDDSAGPLTGTPLDGQASKEAVPSDFAPAPTPAPAASGVVDAPAAPTVPRTKTKGKSTLATGPDSFINIAVPPLPDDPFSQYPAPDLTVPNARDMAAVLARPASMFDDAQPPLVQPDAPADALGNFPSAASWKHVELAGKTMDEVKSALGITEAQPWGSVSTYHPKDPATGVPQMKKGYAVDGRAVHSLYGGDESKAPPLNAWVELKRESLERYVDGKTTGFRITFDRAGLVKTVTYPSEGSHRILLRFSNDNNRLFSASEVAKGDVPDGQVYEYFANGAPQCVRGTQVAKSGNTFIKQGRTACYDKQGRLLRESYFKNNRLSGTQREYEQGKLVKKEAFVDGKVEGVTVYYGRSHIGRWDTYHADKRNGPYMAYGIDRSGKLVVREAGTFVEDERDGPMWTYREDGSLATIAHYKAGKDLKTPIEVDAETGLIRVLNVAATADHEAQLQKYDYDGNLELLEYRDNAGQIILSLSFQNGQLSRRTTYRNGKKDGLEVYYSESEQGPVMMQSTTTFVAGQEKGRYVSYNWAGELTDSGTH